MPIAFKKIKDYNALELDMAIDTAKIYCKEKDLDFFKILNGIDAYFERRSRKDREATKEDHEKLLQNLKDSQ